MRNFKNDQGIIALYKNVQYSPITQEKTFTSAKGFIIDSMFTISKSQFKIDPQFPRYKST